MKRVLLTGGTGFIGRHAVAPLRERGFDIHLIVHKSTPAPGAGVTPHECDLFDSAAVQSVVRKVSPSHLLHFAWYAEHGKYWTSDLNLSWVAASLALAQSFAETGGRRAVFAGTCAEYDWSHGVCDDKRTPLNPRTLYGAAKNGLRQIIEQHARTRGYSTAWGRIFFLFGPGENPARLAPSIALPLLCGERAVCRAGNAVRDVMHAADVAGAFVALLDSTVEGPVNIASGDAVTLGDFARRIAAAVGRPELLDVQSVAPTSDNPASLLADVSRLRDEVKWRPRLLIQDAVTSFVADLRHGVVQ